MKKENLGYIQVVLAQIFFSFMYIFVRSVESFGTYNLAFSRVILSAIFLFIFSLLYKKYKISSFKEEKLKLLFFGAIHGFIIIATYISIYFLSVASAMLLQSTLTIFMIIFSALILKEKIHARVYIAITLAFIGLVILLSPEGLFVKKSFVGICAGLFVGVFGGLVYVLSKTFKTYGGISLTFWQNLIASPFLIPLLFLQKPNLSLFNISFVLIIALLGTLGFVFLFTGLRKARGSNSSLLTLLNVVLTIILAMFFFNETPSVSEIIGGILILTGIYLVLINK